MPRFQPRPGKPDCPLMRMGNLARTGGIREGSVDCIEEKCILWDEEEKDCLIALALAEIKNKG